MKKFIISVALLFFLIASLALSAYSFELVPFQSYIGEEKSIMDILAKP